MKFAAPEVSLTVLGILAVAGCVTASADDWQLEQSRELAQSFGMRLKAELGKGLEEGGPVLAVNVCKDIAPQIVSELSRQRGVKVTRTSLRY